jgi:hypothetical protein
LTCILLHSPETKICSASIFELLLTWAFAEVVGAVMLFIGGRLGLGLIVTFLTIFMQGVW